MREENKQLKQKILQIEGTQKKKIFELVTPSNTSLRTQATDWFLSKEASFSESSCSSNDSIVLLNNQVKEIKEMKTVNKSRGYHNAKISASLRNTSNLEQFFQDIKRKISFGSWGSVYKSPIEEEITYLPRNSGKKTFLSTALLADLPTIRF